MVHFATAATCCAVLLMVTGGTFAAFKDGQQAHPESEDKKWFDSVADKKTFKEGHIYLDDFVKYLSANGFNNVPMVFHNREALEELWGAHAQMGFNKYRKSQEDLDTGKLPKYDGKDNLGMGALGGYVGGKGQDHAYDKALFAKAAKGGEDGLWTRATFVKELASGTVPFNHMRIPFNTEKALRRLFNAYSEMDYPTFKASQEAMNKKPQETLAAATKQIL